MGQITPDTGAEESAPDGSMQGHVLACDSQTYTLTGVAANLVYSGLITPPTYELAAGTGSFTFSGISAGLLAGRVLQCDVQAYVLSGVDSRLAASRLLSADTQSYTLSGIDAALVASRVLGCDTQSYTLTGNAATLAYSGAAASAAGAYYRRLLYLGDWQNGDI